MTDFIDYPRNTMPFNTRCRTIPQLNIPTDSYCSQYSRRHPACPHVFHSMSMKACFNRFFIKIYNPSRFRLILYGSLSLTTNRFSLFFDISVQICLPFSIYPSKLFSERWLRVAAAVACERPNVRHFSVPLLFRFSNALFC